MHAWMHVCVVISVGGVLIPFLCPHTKIVKKNVIENMVPVIVATKHLVSCGNSDVISHTSRQP